MTGAMEKRMIYFLFFGWDVVGFWAALWSSRTFLMENETTIIPIMQTA
jgi:hypothetical protein